MRRLLICACALALPCTGWAQSGKSATSWRNLSTLRAGEKIQVVDTSREKHSGAFVSFSDRSITMKGKHETEMIQRVDVASVSVTERHTLRKALIGGAIGAGAGAGIGAATCGGGNYKPSTGWLVNLSGWSICTRGEGAAIGAGVLGGVGLLVGGLIGLHRGRKLLYSAPESQ